MLKNILLTLLVSSCLIPTHLHAVGSGAYSNDFGDARALSNALAVVARIDSPAANWYNPACLTQTEGAQISLSGMYERLNTDFDSVYGRNIEADQGNYFFPSFFYSQNLNKQWAFGIGVNSPFGLKSDWSDPVTNYVATLTELKVILLNANVAYAVSDRFSVAFGADLARADGTMKKHLNETVLNSALYSLSTGDFALIPSLDATSSLEGSDTGYGWNVGFLYKINDQVKVGLTYRSSIDFSLDGKVTLSDLNSLTSLLFGGDLYKVDASLDLPLPGMFTLGVAYQITDKTSVEIDTELAQWSKVDQFKLDYSGETDPFRLLVLNLGNPIEKDWKDTWNLALGIEHKINETYTLSAGTRYRPSPVPEKSVEISMPSSALYDLHGGLSISFESSRLDFCLSYIQGKERTIENTIGNDSGTSVNGEYHMNCFVLGTTYTYKF
jgi:long-chain fatty acid transport protein